MIQAMEAFILWAYFSIGMSFKTTLHIYAYIRMYVNYFL